MSGVNWRDTVGGAILALLAVVVVYLLGGFDFLAAAQVRNGLHDAAIESRFTTIAQRRAEFDNSWYGIPLLQFPEDLMVYQDCLSRIKPDVIIETGTYQGGLTLYLATLLDFVHPDGKIITVDYDPKYWREGAARVSIPGKERLLNRITFIEGSSTAPAVLDQIRKQVPAGARVMVILDSLHSKEHVGEEIKLYSPLVSKDSYLIVNDTHLDGKTTEWDARCGAGVAVREWLPTTDQFVADKAAERFLVSCSHGGLLKRIK